jgi:citrate synthase
LLLLLFVVIVVVLNAQKRNRYACKFIEMVLMLTADHGPAVAGAHNTIVTARAGKDLVSALWYVVCFCLFVCLFVCLF